MSLKQRNDFQVTEESTGPKGDSYSGLEITD